MNTRTRLLAASLMLAISHGAAAVAIIDNMDTSPGSYPGVSNNYPWTAVIFGDTVMSANAGITTLSTYPNEGVWYGNGSLIGHNPGWHLGNSASGNYLSITMKLSEFAADWNLYFNDLDGYGASLLFNPAGGYDQPRSAGFEYGWVNEAQEWQSTFVALDLSSDFHTFEILLKNGRVEYALNNQLLFSGLASQSGSADLLVIGDGSGTTPTGLGTMFIDQTIFDNAPTFNHLDVNAVPVPASAWLLGSALLSLAQLARRKRLA